VPVILKRAGKAEKLALRLDEARDRIEIGTDLCGVYVLDKGAGEFTLTFVFYDGTKIELSQAEVTNGDEFAWKTTHLLLTNTAQAGKSLKLLLGFAGA